MNIISPRHWTRRRLLQGLGAGAALLPLVPPLRGEAAEAEAPKRLVLFFTPNGTLYDTWKPTGSETDFQMGEILEPLAPYQDQLNVVDGIRLNWAGNGGGHFLGMAGLWTGSAMGGDGWADGISVDQHVAAQIGGETPFASLEFGVQTSGANAGTKRHMCYAGPSQPVPSEDDPASMFDRIFGNFAGGTDPGQQAELERVVARRQSILALARDDLQRLRDAYGAEDREKLEAHLDAIAAIEQRLDVEVTASCDPPSAPIVSANDPSAFPEVLRLQTDLLVASLACDLTRVASLQASYAQSFHVLSWLGVADKHHAISHMDHGQVSVQQQITTINRWYAEQFAYLLQGLASVPEGNGTLLDNTLVVWGNEMARGQGHTPWPSPFVTAGSAGGSVITGRSLDYGDTPHQRLLVSICHAMGMTDVQTFGTLDSGSGPLPGF